MAQDVVNVVPGPPTLPTLFAPDEDAARRFQIIAVNPASPVRGRRYQDQHKRRLR